MSLSFGQKNFSGCTYRRPHVRVRQCFLLAQLSNRPLSRLPCQTRRLAVTPARNPRYDDDYVEIDDEDRWDKQVPVCGV